MICVNARASKVSPCYKQISGKNLAVNEAQPCNAGFGMRTHIADNSSITTTACPL